MPAHKRWIMGKLEQNAIAPDERDSNKELAQTRGRINFVIGERPMIAMV
jgi:hypothetical protein